MRSAAPSLPSRDPLGDYARIEKAIAFLRASAPKQPSLEEVAAAVHLSPFHLQRLFTRWAGISPKRLLQVLTVEAAKERLRASADVLSTAIDVGLSSPSRLHDLFVSLEAMTPGEYKSGGAPLEITYGLHETRLGRCLIARTRRGICRVEFLDEAEDPGVEGLARDWPGAALHRDEAVTHEIAARLFDVRRSGPWPVWVRGTNFQVQVWRALLRIPPGSVVSYQQVAAAVGRPDAVRAVAGAVGANPVAILIPCHRVLRASGALGGYRWGEERKMALHALEWATAE